MTEQELLRMRDLAEAGQVQFKERIVDKSDKYDIGCEMVAFRNSLEYDSDVKFTDGNSKGKDITHAADEFLITIPRKISQAVESSDKTDKWIILKYILTLFAVMWSAVVGVEAREPERGYRGFADLNFALMLNGGYGDPDIYYGISTSHGYQFNPHLFVGAGLEWEHVHEAGYLWEVGQMPVFIHARTDWTLKNRYPVYGDLRVGGVIFGEYRLYIAPTVGYRFNWGKKLGLNLGAGVTLRGYGWSDTKTIHPLPTFRLGLDF